jgi:hypothetical protein
MSYSRCLFSRSGLTILESIVVLVVCSMILLVAIPVGMVHLNMLHPPSIQSSEGKKELKESPPIVVPPMPDLPKPTPPMVPGLDTSGRIIIEGQSDSKSPSGTSKP